MINSKASYHIFVFSVLKKYANSTYHCSLRIFKAKASHWLTYQVLLFSLNHIKSWSVTISGYFNSSACDLWAESCISPDTLQVPEFSTNKDKRLKEFSLTFVSWLHFKKKKNRNQIMYHFSRYKTNENRLTHCQRNKNLMQNLWCFECL